jgi:hypothetical protein
MVAIVLADILAPGQIPNRAGLLAVGGALLKIGARAAGAFLSASTRPRESTRRA